MADLFYEDLRDDAVYKLLVSKGFDMVLSSSREPTIDPNTGVISAPAVVVETTVKGIFRFFSQDEVDHENVLANDLQALIEAKTLATAGISPDTCMKLTAKGTEYIIVRTTPTQPGGIAVLYRLQVRK